MDGEKICSEYAKLVNRALRVIADAPYFKFVGDPETAHLSILGDNASLVWFCATGGYYDDGALIEEDETVEFPSTLLYISESELAEWKDEAKAAYEKKQAQAKKAAIIRDAETTEKRERTTLANLKAKYE